MRIYLLVLILICSTGAYAIEVREKDLIFNVPIPYNFADVNIDVIGENEYYVPLKIIEKKDNISIQSGIIYKYFDAWIGTYRVKKAIIKYRINNSWIEYNNINSIDIFRLNKTSKEWDKLDSDITNKDNNYTYLESETEYLSSFIIVGFKEDRLSREESDTITLSDDVDEVEITEDEGIERYTNFTPVKESPGFDFKTILMMIFIILIMIYNRRNNG